MKNSFCFALLISLLNCFNSPAHAVKLTEKAYKHHTKDSENKIVVQHIPMDVNGRLEVYVQSSARIKTTQKKPKYQLITHQQWLEDKELFFSYRFERGGLEGGCRLIYSYYDATTWKVVEISYDLPGHFQVYGPHLLQWYMDEATDMPDDSGEYSIISPLQGNILSMNISLINSLPDNTEMVDSPTINGNTDIEYFRSTLALGHHKSGSRLKIIPMAEPQDSQGFVVPEDPENSDKLVLEPFILDFQQQGERENKTFQILNSSGNSLFVNTLYHSTNYTLSTTPMINAAFLDIHWPELSGQPQNWYQQLVPTALEDIPQIQVSWQCSLMVLAIIIAIVFSNYYM